MSEDDSGGLVDPGGIMAFGPVSVSNYFQVQHPEAAPCSCKPRRWALMTLHQDGAECPRCHREDPAQDRQTAAPVLGGLADLLRDMPDTAGRALGLVLILAALLGYLAVEGWLPR